MIESMKQPTLKQFQAMITKDLKRLKVKRYSVLARSYIVLVEDVLLDAPPVDDQEELNALIARAARKIIYRENLTK